jgi:hypothetical protein
MAGAAATTADMGKKTSSGASGRKPNRRPSVTLYARVEPQLGQAFKDYVDSLRPRTDVQAVIEMLIEQHLKGLSLWPPPDQPDPS